MNFKNKRILVTGGNGFLAKSLIRKLLKDNAKIKVIIRNDLEKITEFKQNFPNIEILIGDISDTSFINKSICDIDGIFHLAALVVMPDDKTKEGINTNIIGSLNILEQSLKQPMEFIIATSSDKAVQISSSYGASKFLMEKLFKQFEGINKNCKYRIIRFGNIIYSPGTVLHKWRQMIKEKKDIIVTDLKATRFFSSLDESIDLMYNCLDNTTDATPYVSKKIKSVTIENLLEAMIEKYSPKDFKPNIKIIGLREWENLHEKLENGKYSNEVEQYTIEEIKKFI